MTTISNVTQFAREIRAFSEKIVPADVLKLHKKIALQAIIGVVIKTPVDTGRARGGWQTDTGNFLPGDPNILDKSGGLAITTGEAKIAALRPFGVVFISNNVSYIEALEEGTSIQAPEGMLAVTVEELKDSFP